jgi:hypothetical protein
MLCVCVAEDVVIMNSVWSRMPPRNLNSRVQHPVARVSIGFTNVYYHRTQLLSLFLYFICFIFYFFFILLKSESSCVRW